MFKMCIELDLRLSDTCRGVSELSALSGKADGGLHVSDRLWELGYRRAAVLETDHAVNLRESVSVQLPRNLHMGFEVPAEPVRLEERQ